MIENTKEEICMLLTLIFVLLLVSIFGKLFFWSIKAAWGITKILLTIVVFPVILIGVFAAGLSYLAIVVLIIVGIVTLIRTAVS